MDVEYEEANEDLADSNLLGWPAVGYSRSLDFLLPSPSLAAGNLTRI